MKPYQKQWHTSNTAVHTTSQLRRRVWVCRTNGRIQINTSENRLLYHNSEICRGETKKTTERDYTFEKEPNPSDTANLVSMMS